MTPVAFLIACGGGSDDTVDDEGRCPVGVQVPVQFGYLGVGPAAVKCGSSCGSAQRLARRANSGLPVRW